MKLIFNVYRDIREFESGKIHHAEAGGAFDHNLATHPKNWELLGQVVSEIEQPKKEVEKIAIPSIYDDIKGHKRVSIILPEETYGFELHYKIKE